MCIEEPLEQTNAARAVVRREAFDDVLSALKSAAKEADRKRPNVEKWMGRVSGQQQPECVDLSD